MALDHRTHTLANSFLLRIDGRMRRGRCTSRVVAQRAARNAAEKLPGKPIEVLAVLLGGHRILVDTYARHHGELRHLDVAAISDLYVLP
jgi:hypothetical protein